MIQNSPEFGFERIVFVANPNGTQQEHEFQRRNELLIATGLSERDTINTHDFPTPAFFDEAVGGVKSLVAFYSGDGGQRYYTEAFSGSSDTTIENATLAYLQGGNGCNAARDTHMPKDLTGLFKGARIAPLHVLDYDFTSVDGETIDKGIAITCINTGITGLASGLLETNKPWVRRLGTARIIPEAFIAAAAAFSQPSYYITLPTGHRRHVATADVLNSSHIAKNTVDRTGRVAMTTPEILVYAPAYSEKHGLRELQITRSMGMMAIGYSDGGIVDLSGRALRFSVETDHPVPAAIDGELAPHGEPVYLGDGTQVAISHHPKTFSVLTRSAAKNTN